MITKKIPVLFLACLVSICASATLSFASADPNAYTAAYIGYVIGSDTHVRGKAYAYSTNPKFRSINVHGTMYRGSSNLESGTGTSTTAGQEAQWFSNHYNHNFSYTLQSASRTYYNDGTSSSQSYASYSW